MKKILILLLLWIIPLTGFAFTELFIDEYKTDVYFGNGILTEEQDAIDNADLLEKSIIKDIYNNNEDEMYKYIGKVDYAYNSTKGEILDLWESLVQKLNGTPVAALDRSNRICGSSIYYLLKYDIIRYGKKKKNGKHRFLSYSQSWC